MRTLSRISVCLLFLLPVMVYAQSSNAVDKNVKSNDTSSVFAIVIGISDYKNINPLNYADKDAVQFFLHLRTAFPMYADNFFIFLNDKAAKLSIESKFAYINEKIKPGDKVILYFSGHGDIEETDSTGNFLFLLGEAQKKNYQQKENTVLEKRFFDEYISKWIQQRVKTIFICDACRSGTLIGGTEGIRNNANAFMQNWQGQSKILACQPNELSYEFKNLGGGSGTFTYYLILGLKGLADADNDGKISLLELQTWLTGNVYGYVKKEGAGQSQIPEITGDKSYIISKTNARLLLQAKTQLSKNTATNEYLQLSAVKGNAIKIGDNLYLYKSNDAAKKGFSYLDEKDPADQVRDNYYKSVYYNFKSKLKDGTIFFPEEISAYHYYEIFNSQDNYKPVKAEMRIQLLEALDKYFDDITTSLYSGDDSSFYNELSLYNEHAFKIITLLADGNEVLLSKNIQRQLFAAASLKLLNSNIADITGVAESFQQFVQIDSLSPYILLQAGMASFLSRKYDEALGYYDRYKKQLPNDEYIYFREAIVYETAGKRQEAIEALEKSVAINADFIPGAALLKKLKE